MRLFIPYKDYSAEEHRHSRDGTSGFASPTSPTGWMPGLQDIGIVDEQIRALWKDTEKFTHRTVGIAVTARYVPSNRREPQMDNKTVSRCVRHDHDRSVHEGAASWIGPGDRCDGGRREPEHRVVEHPGWKKLGMVGLVTSGGLADTDEIIYHKVPVWFRRYARGFRPGRNELESVNRPVTIGGVLVRPGDVVVADGDGVVVVPRERAEEVAKASLPFLDNITRERYIKETGRTVGQEARRRELRARNGIGRRVSAANEATRAERHRGPRERACKGVRGTKSPR